MSSAGERLGIKGRRTIRGEGTGHVGIWSLKAQPGTTLARLESVYLKSLNAVDQIAARKTEAAKSGRYTDDGLKAEIRQYAAERLAPDLHRGKHQVAAAKREAAEMRSRIKLPSVDKSDISGAFLRAEMRDFIRSMPKAERDAYVAQGNLDPQIAVAIMEVPSEMSGVSAVQKAALHDKALEAANPGALAKVQELEHAVELCERAVGLGEDEVAKDADLNAQQLQELAAPYLRNSNTPWLRKSGDKVAVVDLERGVTRDPTPEDLANGMQFADYSEYAAANGLAE